MKEVDYSVGSHHVKTFNINKFGRKRRFYKKNKFLNNLTCGKKLKDLTQKELVSFTSNTFYDVSVFDKDMFIEFTTDIRRNNKRSYDFFKTYVHTTNEDILAIYKIFLNKKCIRDFSKEELIEFILYYSNYYITKNSKLLCACCSDYKSPNAFDKKFVYSYICDKCDDLLKD